MAIGGCANVHVVESLLLTDGMLGMAVVGIVEVTNIKLNLNRTKSWHSPCNKVDLKALGIIHRQF